MIDLLPVRPLLGACFEELTYFSFFSWPRKSILLTSPKLVDFSPLVNLCVDVLHFFLSLRDFSRWGLRWPGLSPSFLFLFCISRLLFFAAAEFFFKMIFLMLLGPPAFGSLPQDSSLSFGRSFAPMASPPSLGHPCEGFGAHFPLPPSLAPPLFLSLPHYEPLPFLSPNNSATPGYYALVASVPTEDPLLLPSVTINPPSFFLSF